MGYQAIYSFGDSLTDAGDAYLLSVSTTATLLGQKPTPVNPPYYKETYGNLSADVFSNGPVWVQDLATTLGGVAPGPGTVGAYAQTITNLANASGYGFLGSAFVAQLELQQNTTGNNPYLVLASGATGGTDFAIGGSVTGVTGENAGASVPLTDLAAQLSNFQNTITTPVAGALYTVWSGSNDLINLLEDPNFSTLFASGAAATDVTTSVTNEVSAVKSLVSGGAQSVLVLNVPDLGKTPTFNSGTYAAFGSVASAYATSFDQQLAATLASTNFGTAKVSLEDTYGLIDAAVANPATYGLTNVTTPVYSGSFTSGSTPPVSTVPSVQNTYLFFDSLHPTSTGQGAIATLAQTTLNAACFAAGTLITLESGACAVEDLPPGALVRTRTGLRPVRWVGHRRVMLAQEPQRCLAQPVRITAGAFGAGLPQRDLLLSPEHAVFHDGVLVPVRCLVGCTGIAVDPAHDEITYYHVELDPHDVLLAEGLPCESWLDTGNRWMFDNAPATPTPNRQSAPCAPVVESGPALHAMRASLGAGATQMVQIQAIGTHRARLPAGTGAVRLASLTGHAPGDARRLGVAISALWLDDEPLTLDDARLGSGFHAPEGGGWRWTDGDGMLHVAGARSLQVEVTSVAA